MNKNSGATSSSPLIDWPALLRLYDHRQAFIDRLMEVAHVSLADMPPAIRQAIEQQDYPQLAFIAHGLRGSACNLEVPALLDLAGQTEATAREARADALSLAEDLARLVEALRAELARHLAKQQPGSGA
jgi:HPt (histidine-containing phosphotransfer) domain-containing protein